MKGFVICMGFDIVGAFVMGVIGALLIRERSGQGVFAFIFALFGYFLAGTGLHGGINSILHGIVNAVAQFLHSHTG